MLAAIANAVGLTEPLRLKLWGVNGVGETPQPLHSPYNICEHHLPNRAFDSHGIKLEGGKKYGSNGVLFYQVFPYDILQLRDNVAVELEVILRFRSCFLNIVIIAGGIEIDNHHP